MYQPNTEISHDYYHYYLSQNLPFPHSIPIFPPTYMPLNPIHNHKINFSQPEEIVNSCPNEDSIQTLVPKVSKNITPPYKALKAQAIKANPGRASSSKKRREGSQIKLRFRTQWKNENRNIVPNLVNQMMSFILKKSKSSKLINRLFQKYNHGEQWSPRKFYLYVKKIKDSVSHYVNQSIIQYFFQIHEPKCEIYSEEEQQFYMKLCRIAVLSFLQSDAIIISLTSSRMSEAKRKTHLIARQALLNKFLQLARH